MTPENMGQALAGAGSESLTPRGGGSAVSASIAAVSIGSALLGIEPPPNLRMISGALGFRDCIRDGPVSDLVPARRSAVTDLIPPSRRLRGGTVIVMKPDSRVVYSSLDGDRRKARDPQLLQRRADGDRVKVRREVAGRRGKAVTTVSGVPVDEGGLRELATKLKKRCGVGGSVKDGVIEIQGDHRAVVVALLETEGYEPILAGG
jgi:translation initiation factor 1